MRRSQDAVLPPAARRALAGLLRAGTHVAVVSGRSLADVKSRVAVPGIHYAGNHGLEIDGPALRWTHPGARAAARELKIARRRLARDLAGLKGVRLEDKGLGLSAHYREAGPGAGPAVRSRMLAALPAGSRLRLCAGHQVWELRPRLRWNKGHALRAIAARLSPKPALFFAGDDRTDEEGFRTLGSRCLNVRVGEAEGSAAGYFLKDPEEVRRLLARLARARRPSGPRSARR